MVTIVSRMAVASLALLAQFGEARAAELKVFSTIGVKSVLEQLAPGFEKASGHKLDITWSTGSLLARRIQDGETADMLIAALAEIEALTGKDKLARGTSVVISRVIFAVGIRKGAAKPDISTPDAFKEALLAAKSVAYTNPAAGGQSGVYFAKQLDRMGIADAIKAKSKFPPAGGFVSHLLLSGEVDLAIQSKPELLSVDGVEILGPLPGDMAYTSTHVAAVAAAAKNPVAAKALIDFLRLPESQAVFRAKGYDPGS